jgi:hypothetical protein
MMKSGVCSPYPMSKSSRKFNLFFSDLFLSKFYFLTFSFPSPHIPSFSNGALYRVGMDMNLGIYTLVGQTPTLLV